MDVPVIPTKALKTMGNMTTNPRSNWPELSGRIRQATAYVPLQGIPGFHVVEEVGSGARLAPMKMDKDINKGRVNTGTGEEPALPGTSRFGTPCASTREDVRL